MTNFEKSSNSYSTPPADQSSNLELLSIFTGGGGGDNYWLHFDTSILADRSLDHFYPLENDSPTYGFGVPP